MANSTIQTKSAVSARTLFNMSHRHINSTSFGALLPLTSLDCIPGDTFKKFKLSTFIRTAPLALPTYGRININSKAFFCPYHLVWEYFEDWKAGKAKSRGYAEDLRIPHIYNSAFVELFVDNSKYATLTTMDNYDFRIDNNDNMRYRFTKEGRFVFQVLRSLGYDILWTEDALNRYYNALPLLCYFRSYYDYFYRSFKFDTSNGVRQLEEIRHTRVPNIGSIYLLTFFTELYLCYDTDYFSRAWNTPTSQISGVFTNDSHFNINNGAEYTVLEKTSLGATLANYNDFVVGSTPRITANGLDILSAVDSYMRRNIYSGSRTLEMIFSHFGIKVDALRNNVPTLVASSSSPLQIGDVTSMAETDSAPLGGYAGKAIGNSSLNFNFHCKDFGMLVVYGYIDVLPIYKSGIDRTCLNTDPLEFYTPELDGVGVQPIPLIEYFVDQRGEISNDISYYSAFGFTERYNHMREHRDIVTGDVALKRYVESEDWALTRDLSFIGTTGVAHAQDEDVIRFKGDQYSRIFTDITDDEDYFYCNHAFDILMERPIKNYTGAAGLPQGALKLHTNGNIE